jgi:hypothetical protein
MSLEIEWVIIELASRASAATCEERTGAPLVRNRLPARGRYLRA